MDYRRIDLGEGRRTCLEAICCGGGDELGGLGATRTNLGQRRPSWAGAATKRAQRQPSWAGAAATKRAQRRPNWAPGIWTERLDEGGECLQAGPERLDEGDDASSCRRRTARWRRKTGELL